MQLHGDYSPFVSACMHSDNLSFSSPAFRIFVGTPKTMAAHARAWHLRDDGIKQIFVACLEQWATTKNISTVVLATDIPNFEVHATCLHTSCYIYRLL